MARTLARLKPAYCIPSLLPILVILVVGLSQAQQIVRFQEEIFDLYQRLAPRPFDSSAPVRIVDIDETSLQRFGQWPWSRARLADLVDTLHRSNAAAIAFDIIFSEEDRMNPEALVHDISDPARRQTVARAITGLPSHDTLFAQAVGAAPVVLGIALSQTANTPTFDVPFGIASTEGRFEALLSHFHGVVAPLPAFIEKASGLGALNWLPDLDQIVRRVPLLMNAGDRVFPSLAVESIRVAQGASTLIVRTGEGGADRSGIDAIRTGDVTIRADPRGDMRLRLTRHQPERFIPAWKILDHAFDPAALAGRIVVVGSSAAGLTDIRATAVDGAMPGVEIQAQAIEQALNGTRLVRPTWHVLELFAAAFLAIGLAVLLPFVPAIAGLALTLTLMLGAITSSFWAFVSHGLLLDPMLPGLMLLLTYIGGVSALFRTEQRERRFVQNAFGRFVSPTVVAQLANDPSQLALGGELTPLTIMFTDIRNFSAISERLGPQDLTRFMNEFLSPMSEIVLNNGGTIDKYIGDSIMAFWNAPLRDAAHARHAASAALTMMRTLPELEKSMTQTGPVADIELRCGIGLATGPCVVGNLGSNARFDYSALGDDVNLASRLESLTKYYGVDLLAAESTCALVADFAWLEVDLVRVVGRASATRVSTLLGDDRFAASDSYRALRRIHDAMLAAYRDRRFRDAQDAIHALAAIAPASLTKLYALYDERCKSLQLAPPPDGWDAVTRMQMK